MVGLGETQVPTKYVTLIKDMYGNVGTTVQTSDNGTDDFLIRIGLHQGSTLSPYFFCFGDGCGPKGYTR